MEKVIGEMDGDSFVYFRQDFGGIGGINLKIWIDKNRIYSFECDRYERCRSQGDQMSL
jgi:hypothetical protein